MNKHNLKTSHQPQQIIKHSLNSHLLQQIIKMKKHSLKTSHQLQQIIKMNKHSLMTSHQTQQDHQMEHMSPQDSLSPWEDDLDDLDDADPVGMSPYENTEADLGAPHTDPVRMPQSPYENMIDHDADAGLSLHLTVDDNCARLKDLEEEVIKLRVEDTEKSRRLLVLEGRVAKLESALLQLQNNTISGPPPIPPRGLPPSPKRRVVPMDAAMPCANRPPPLLSPPNPPILPSQLLPRAPYTPCPPNHPPPPASPDQSAFLSHTPQPPQHPPPQLQPYPPPPQPPLLQPASRSQSVGGKLPSSAIDKSSLLPVNTVIQNNADLVGKDGQMRTMALALAREALFGEG